MGFIRWLFGKKEDISDERIRHASLGDYTVNSNRFLSGGHSQKAIKYMNKTGIKYNITKKYSNGVRVGNVPNHNQRNKRTGDGQSWFPKWWTDRKIKRAGQVVAIGTRLSDGVTKFGYYDNVKVGIIRTHGKIHKVFPMNKQTNKKGKERKWK